MKTLEAAQLDNLITQKKNITVLDILPEEEYERIHIAGAVNACIYELVFMENVKKLIPDKNAAIVVYGLDSQYLAAPLAFNRLKEEGYENVAVLKGGLNGWINDGHAVEQQGEPDQAKSGVFHCDTEKSVARWVGRNLLNQHNGTIRLKEAWLKLEYNLLVGGKAVVDLNTIECEDIEDSGMRKLLIDHLRSADFFLVDKHPLATFELVSAEPIEQAAPGGPNYEITGSLNLRGHTDELLFEAALGWNKESIGLQAHFDVDRVTWGSQYGSGKLFERLGQNLVNDSVSISFQLVAPIESAD